MTQQRANRSRLMIDLSPELRRRIRMAAAQRDVSVRQYVEGILEQVVPDIAKDSSATALSLDAAMAARIDALRARVMHGRVFEDDSTAILHKIRSERLEQL